jgi:hypothetical protein
MLVAGVIEPDHINELGPAPCDGCRFAARCAELHLACESFSAFVSGASEIRWQAAPRKPNGAIFARLYGKAA